MTEIFKHIERGQPVVIQAVDGLTGYVIEESFYGGKDVTIKLEPKVVKPARKVGAEGRERLDPNNRNWPCG